MRALGIDYGERRVGLAISDPTGTLASPLDTLVRRIGRRPPIGRIVEIAGETEAEAIVIGLPLALDGTEPPIAADVRAFGSRLQERGDLPVHFVDERFTSVEAEAVVRSSGLPRRKREEKGRIDAAAAALILQSWLDGAPEL